MASDPGRRGLMLVLSSPSGAGKSTLARLLLDSDDNLIISVSVTTRKRRPSEVDGVHYHFIDRERFLAMRDAGELLEWAEVHGNLYATPRGPVEAALAAGHDMLFDIDWQGAQQLKEKMPDDVVGIFVLPPTMEELQSRLVRRAEDDSDVIARRLANARSEIGHWVEYDYVFVNRDLQETLKGAQAVLVTERGRRRSPPEITDVADRFSRTGQATLPAFIAQLLSE
ncbi:guanylate kinase [Bauldia sp.]|uniref:guanylate kinase n=1 Tax=Bauldia sp. TaxID=2575872 RepID=UPI0025BA27F4|nr:guanylate kinase [Bauldia sp.]